MPLVNLLGPRNVEANEYKILQETLMINHVDRILVQDTDIPARPDLTRKRRQLEERLENREIAFSIDDFENFPEETVH